MSINVAWVFIEVYALAQPTMNEVKDCISIVNNCSWVGKPTLQNKESIL